jgi:hypothetical protein
MQPIPYLPKACRYIMLSKNSIFFDSGLMVTTAFFQLLVIPEERPILLILPRT